jgi:hypothetical protein
MEKPDPSVPSPRNNTLHTHTEDLFENRKITYFSKKNVVLK